MQLLCNYCSGQWPDHYARLAAVKHLRDFMAAGRPAPKAPEKKEEERPITHEELNRLVRQRMAKAVIAV